MSTFVVPIYQQRHGSWLTWTTVGAGELTQSREGAIAAKLEQSLGAALRKAVEEGKPEGLISLSPRVGMHLARERIELSLTSASLGRRKVSGLCPVILEPRDAGADRRVTIAYHPLRQKEWFIVSPGEPLGPQLAACFARAWAELPDDEIEDLWSNGRDLLRSMSFAATPPSLLDRLEKKKGPWDDLDADPTRSKPKKPAGTRLLSELGTDLTAEIAGEPPRLLPREPCRRELAALLDGTRRASTVLVGPPSAGRTSVLSTWVADLLLSEDYPSHQNLDRVTHVWSLSGRRLIAGMSHVGDWEKRAMELLACTIGKKVVLFIPDLFRFGKLGQARESTRSFADFFRGPVARGELTIVGECTAEQLAMFQRDAPAFAASFTRVHVPPATPAETFRILVEHARAIEPAANVSFSPYALRSVLELSSALMPNEASPGGSVRLLREVAKAAPRADAEAGPREIDGEAVVRAVGQLTGLPRALIEPDVRLSPEDVRRELSRQVIGQPSAVDAMVDLVARIKSGLVDPRRPYGVYLFTGPTGTGKTELARAMAEYLYGSSARLLRFDMSEFGGADATARLIGHPGDPEGLLTRSVTAQPMSVILLDEIDKAHPSVHNLFLSLFDDARLTDAAGSTASFAHTVIIMTSNLGARPREAMGFATSPDAVLHDVSRAVREFFSPELFNRIDRVVPFSPLSEEVAVDVAEKELGKLLSRRGLGERNVFVRCSRGVARTIARRAFRERDGARSMKRFIEDQIGTQLSLVLSSAPSALMRMLWLFDSSDAPSGVVVEDEPLLEVEPQEGVVYVARELDGVPIESLRGRLPDLLPALRAAEDAPLPAGDARVFGEEHRAAVLALRERIERSTGVSDDPFDDQVDSDRYERLSHGRGFDYTERRFRRNRGDAAEKRGTPMSREEIVAAFVEATRLERVARDVADPEAHSVVLEIVSAVTPAGPRFSTMAEASDGLVAWLASAYTKLGLSVEEHAAQIGERRHVGRGPDALAKAMSQRPTVLALRLSGLGARDALILEHGTHLWQPLAAGPELVRVRVLSGSLAPSQVLADHMEKKRAFDAASQSKGGGGAPPPNPARLLPLVRKIRFEPPRRDGEVALLELEDYVLGHAADVHAARVDDVVVRLIQLRTSRKPAGDAR